MLRRTLNALAALMVAAGAVGAARADVVFDSFDPGGGFSGQNSNLAAGALNGIVVTANRMAVQFGVCGAGYTLDSVTIPIARQANGITAELLRVRITEDASGAPGATLEVLSQNQPTPANASPFTMATTYNSTAHPRLAGGRSYWVVAELTAMPTFTGPGTSVNYLWYQNTSGATVQAKMQQRIGGLPQDPWPATTTATTSALRVNGTALVVAACCNPSTRACALIETGACAAVGLTVVAGSSTCTPTPCPPACPGDFNHVNGVTVQDIFDFLAAWFAPCP